MKNSFEIRRSTESELDELLNIHFLAFGQDEGPVASKLVKDLLNDKTAIPILSLVAVENGKLVGHILFTKAVITNPDKLIPTQILAPLAILPRAQNKGFGEKLINEGLRILKELGTELVFVLGLPTYYPRCGFIPAGAQGFEAPYPIPEEHSEAWMLLELNGDVLKNNSGKVQCSKALDEPKYWSE